MTILLFIITILVLVLIFGFVALYIVGLWNLFKKAGRNGWEALVPFYNTWVLVEISGLAWWYALIILLTNIANSSDNYEVNIIFSICSIIANFFNFYNLSKKFHKDTGFAILLTFFSFIMIPIIGFSDKYQYDKNVVVSENGPINSGKQMQSSNSSYEPNNNFSEVGYCSNCGNKLHENERFCGICGNQIK